MNLTDVDDRTITRRGRGRRADVDAHTAPFIEAFFEDRDYLRIQPAHALPARRPSFVPADDRAWSSGCSSEGRRLQGRGRLGLLRDRAFPGVRPAVAARQARAQHRRERPGGERRVRQGGRRATSRSGRRPSRRTRRSARRGTRRSAAAGPAGTSSARRWRSTWSARSYGVDVLDIHAGGVDLIFPHHEDEIAQSCAFTGKPVRALLDARRVPEHPRHQDVEALRELSPRRATSRRTASTPARVRLLVFQTHYRQTARPHRRRARRRARGRAAARRIRRPARTCDGRRGFASGGRRPRRCCGPPSPRR